MSCTSTVEPGDAATFQQCIFFYCFYHVPSDFLGFRFCTIWYDNTSSHVLIDMPSFHCLPYSVINSAAFSNIQTNLCLFIWLCSRNFRHSRHADEGRIAAVEEGAVDDLQDEGEVLQRQEGDGGAEREQQALQRRQEEGEDGGLQVGVLLTLPCEQPPAQPSVGEEQQTQQITATCWQLLFRSTTAWTQPLLIIIGWGICGYRHSHDVTQQSKD